METDIGIEMKRIEENEYDNYRKLFKKVFKRELSEEEFLWKYINTPFNSEPLIYIAKNHDGDMVAARSFFPTEIVIDNKKIKAVQAGDTMVCEGYRRKGIFKLLTLKGMEDLKEMGYELIFNFPNQNSYKGYMSLGWSEISSIDQYYRILSFEGILSQKLGFKTLAKLISVIANTLYTLFKPIDDMKSKDKSSHKLSIIDRLSSEDEELIAKFLEGKTYQVKKDEYFQWRYNQSPRGDYEFIAYNKNEDGVIEGLAVVKKHDRKQRKSAEILEWICDKQKESEFLTKVMVHYKEQGFHDILVWCRDNDENFGNRLKEKGFISRSLPLRFVIKSLISENHQITILNSDWHIHKGDGDTA